MLKLGLKVAETLVSFIEDKALPGTGLSADVFWQHIADIFRRFSPENGALLKKRDSIQRQLDDWHREHRGLPIDQEGYQAFLREIGYLTTEPQPFTIGTRNVDDEIARTAGPQLVVPALNARFLLNAANARWGSLYDALYGTDALDGGAAAGGFDPKRGAAVIERAREFLDAALPLKGMKWAQLNGFRIWTGDLAAGVDYSPEILLLGQVAGGQGAWTQLADPSSFVGYIGHPGRPAALLFRHHGLHIEVRLDRDETKGFDDPAGIADVILEAALTTIVDLEDSVAAVDADDKVAAYANWLGLMRGDLVETFQKAGRPFIRRLNPDREFTSPTGGSLTLPGRSLLFVRNVGHLMTTPAVLLPDGSEAPEGILDAIVTSLCALHDKGRNSRTGSIYIVKPKMHGPEEAAFTNRLFDAVEDLLRLDRHTIKVGVMDEERRTSANLAACIHAVKDRVAFINTGFLDRTGDEIHTSMHAGPMVPKGEMRVSTWISAYEDRNVRIGLACGLSGRAQIGKGMWAAPDRMADMLEQKVAHPKSGANTAWVPSPTAATLHAMHYHLIDVFAVQEALRSEPVPPLEKLLSVPLELGRNWSEEEVARELDNNAQGILGYVVRWIDQGIGCSKVPDINDVGLMEDRATLRISSQAIANWLLHGVCTPEQVEAAFQRMAKKVDAQNAGDPLYLPLNQESIAYQAARALVFEGVEQPNGYTEPLLHRFRTQVKAKVRAPEHA